MRVPASTIVLSTVLIASGCVSGATVGYRVAVGDRN